MIVGVLIAGGLAAGVFGSLLGLGGGILLVPLLTLGVGLPLREAVGVSLVAVIVTSSASASVYLERHVANLRLGMTLELFTAIGALVGGLVAFLIAERVLAGLFALLLGYTAVSMGRRREAAPGPDETAPDSPALVEQPGVPSGGPRAVGIARGGGAPAAAVIPPYTVRNFGRGILGSGFAGIVSALLGIGGGIVKVPVMHLLMGVPLRVATATSNLMIGVTASASAVIYLLRGQIDPFVAAPTAVGVYLGAAVGARIAHRVDVRLLRWLFVVVMLFTAWQMVGRALR